MKTGWSPAAAGRYSSKVHAWLMGRFGAEALVIRLRTASALARDNTDLEAFRGPSRKER